MHLPKPGDTTAHFDLKEKERHNPSDQHYKLLSRPQCPTGPDMDKKDLATTQLLPSSFPQLVCSFLCFILLPFYTDPIKLLHRSGAKEVCPSGPPTIKQARREESFLLRSRIRLLGEQRETSMLGRACTAKGKREFLAPSEPSVKGRVGARRVCLQQ